MNRGILVTLHLLAAIVFAGTVFFEVVMLDAVRKHLPRDLVREVERTIGRRAVAIMPWVLLVLFTAGIGLAWGYRAALARPFDSSLGVLLSIKILLALSVFGHFATAMTWRRRGMLSGVRSKRLHLSVFCHVLLIVILAKAMLYLHW